MPIGIKPSLLNYSELHPRYNIEFIKTFGTSLLNSRKCYISRLQDKFSGKINLLTRIAQRTKCSQNENTWAHTTRKFKLNANLARPNVGG